MSGDIEDAKRRLPLPELMRQLGLGEHAGKSARCPFHEDSHPSFSVFQTERGWFFKCHSGCGEGDEITLLELHPRISNAEATRRYLHMAGVNGYARHPSARARKRQASNFNWKRCVEELKQEHLEHLSKWRGYSPAFCSWLHEHALIGLYRGCFAFPVHHRGEVVAAHYRVGRGNKNPDWFTFRNWKRSAFERNRS
jgi:CHC2 zinc finger